LVVVFDVPPGTNALWRPVWRDGKPDMIRSEPYKRWRKTACQVAAYCREGDKIEGPYALRLTIPGNGYDLDAPLKAISDALEGGGAIQNDKMAARIELVRDLARPPGTILAELWRVE
jgi:Holliday junction resolvase RusA-like endonuclease